MNSRVCRRYSWFGQGARACVAFIAVFAGSSAAMASTCGGVLNSRPGTPDATTAVARSPTSIEFGWRNLTNKGMNKSMSQGGTEAVNDQPHEMYFDIYVRDAKQGQLGKDQTGTGPFKGLVYGSRSSKVFDGLLANKGYCFALRARTGAGTQGCISEQTSAWACATTPPLGTPPVVAVNSRKRDCRRPPPRSPRARLSPTSAFWVNPTILCFSRAADFLSSAKVSIRVASTKSGQMVITNIGGAPITTSASGSLSVTLQGLCKVQGDQLTFTASDGRADPTDKVFGELWSGPVSAGCS